MWYTAVGLFIYLYLHKSLFILFQLHLFFLFLDDKVSPLREKSTVLFNARRPWEWQQDSCRLWFRCECRWGVQFRHTSVCGVMASVKLAYWFKVFVNRWVVSIQDPDNLPSAQTIVVRPTMPSVLPVVQVHAGWGCRTGWAWLWLRVIVLSFLSLFHFDSINAPWRFYCTALR